MINSYFALHGTLALRACCPPLLFSPTHRLCPSRQSFISGTTTPSNFSCSALSSLYLPLYTNGFMSSSFSFSRFICLCISLSLSGSLFVPLSTSLAPSLFVSFYSFSLFLPSFRSFSPISSPFLALRFAFPFLYFCSLNISNIFLYLCVCLLASICLSSRSVSVAGFSSCRFLLLPPYIYTSPTLSLSAFIQPFFFSRPLTLRLSTSRDRIRRRGK